jgi:hypothetical protein
VPLSGQCHLHRYKRSWPPVRWRCPSTL